MMPVANLKDFRSPDSDCRDRFIRSLGQALSKFGYVNITGHELKDGLIDAYYSETSILFGRSNESRLKEFDLMSHGLERGYVANPSGGPKPVQMTVDGHPRVLHVGGLHISLSKRGRDVYARVTFQNQTEQVKMPGDVYNPDNPSSQIKIELYGRRLKFQKTDPGRYLVYAPDNKRSWITGKSHNVYPQEARQFAKVSADFYAAQTQMGTDILRAIGSYLGDKAQTLLNRVIDSDGQNIAPHMMRTYQYHRFSDEELDELGDDDAIIRAGQHKDISFLTLLPKANEGGLEVQGPDGEWLPVYVENEAVLVMAGDLLNRVTRGLKGQSGQLLEIPSPIHRVVGDRETVSADRYSIPFFFNLDLLQSVLSLEDGKPLRIQDPSEGLDVVLDPGLRLFHAHLRSSTGLEGDFERFLENHKSLNNRMDDFMAKASQLRAIYTR